MIKFKACPKCKGDLYLNRDMYGKYLNCFQCGYLKDLTSEEEISLREPVTAAEERKAA
jgi:DNA-directed RNA polymerase subunit M/transcription elongation factor TFIIS